MQKLASALSETGGCSVEQVPDLLAEGGVLVIRHWNASRSDLLHIFAKT
ncbi:MAG: hypothetical protein ACR2NN_14930 [Bryobacteraceae bacterium]